MVRRGTLPIYPNHLTLNYPGASNKRLSLKLLVLKTKIPVACVGVLTISGHALKFSTCALTRSRGWDAWLPWQELPSADSRTMAPPGTTPPPSLPAPELGSALPGDSPSTLTWQAGAPGPFPRVTRAHALPTRPMAPLAPHQRVTCAHYTIPAPHGPLAYHG